MKEWRWGNIYEDIGEVQEKLVVVAIHRGTTLLCLSGFVLAAESSLP